jgi:hypothetical protein
MKFILFFPFLWVILPSLSGSTLPDPDPKHGRYVIQTRLLLQGRIPDAERGGVGHLQPHHLRQQGPGRLPRAAGRHRTLLQVSPPRLSLLPVVGDP